MTNTQQVLAARTTQSGPLNGLRNLASRLLAKVATEPALELNVDAIGTDLDGTLYPFIDYFAPAMEVHMPKLTAKLNERRAAQGKPPVDADVISHALGQKMKEFGSHEYPWLVQCSMLWQEPEWRGLWQDFAEFNDEVIEPFWNALDRQRERDMKLYDDVLETLYTLNELGIKVGALSDGPAHMVKAKVAQAGIDHLLTVVIALDTPEPPVSYNLTDEELQPGRDRVNRYMSTPLRCPFLTNPQHLEKPNPAGLERLMSVLEVTPDRIIYTGDNLGKDGGVAAAHGARYMWCRYGVQATNGHRRIMDLKFVHPLDRAKPGAPKKALPPMLGRHGASTWAQILDYIASKPVPQLPAKLNPSAHSAPTDVAGH